MKKNNKHRYVKQLEGEVKSGQTSRREFLRKSVLLGMSIPVAYGLTGLSMSESVFADNAKKGGNFRVSMRVQEMSDPALFEWSYPSNVARHVIEPLVQMGNDGLARPKLLESWQASDDLKTWTLNLRQNVTWSNGDEFIADDVIFNINRWLDPKTGSSMQSQLISLTHEVDTGEKNDDGSTKMSRVAMPGAVKRIDKHTVQLTLNKADIAIPEALSSFTALIVNRNFTGDFSSNPVGTGAFELVNIEVGVSAILKRRADGLYWGGDALLDQITYVDLGDDTSVDLAAYVSDQIDYSYQVSADQVQAYETIPFIELLSAKSATTGIARMNVTQKPFDDVRVRRAVALAVDNERVLTIGYQDLGSIAENHHVSPIHPEYAPLPKLSRNIDKAKALLAQAGYPNGIDLVIDCSASPSWQTNTCLAIADQVRAAGINLRVNIMPGGSYWDVWNTTPFGLTEWNHRPLGVQVLNLAYRTGAPWNETGYANPEFDRLLGQALTILDAKERSKVVLKLEKILQDDAVMVQPFWLNSYSAVNKRVKNVVLHPSFEHDFNKVWIDA